MEYVELNLNVVVDVLGRLNDFQFIYAIYGKMQENNVVLLFDIVPKAVIVNDKKRYDIYFTLLFCK